MVVQVGEGGGVPGGAQLRDGESVEELSDLVGGVEDVADEVDALAPAGGCGCLVVVTLGAVLSGDAAGGCCGSVARKLGSSGGSHTRAAMAAVGSRTSTLVAMTTLLPSAMSRQACPPPIWWAR
ncbi:hypothetical protein [Micromonospora sp. NPDC005254]|uniref:hypothetical protein n=1 Tax=Micromonospora sp. NPDC005254 TaxID=3364229 RepID=UPI0036BC86EB